MCDFGPGDVVVCVAGDCGGHSDDSAPPTTVVGRTYRVARIIPNRPHWDCLCDGVILAGHRHGSASGTCSHRFRKIDAPDTEISRRIRACKPMKVEAGD